MCDDYFRERKKGREGGREGTKKENGRSDVSTMINFLSSTYMNIYNNKKKQNDVKECTGTMVIDNLSL